MKYLVYVFMFIFLISCGSSKTAEKKIHLKYADAEVINVLPIVMNQKGEQDSTAAYIYEMTEKSLKKLERFQFIDLNGYLLIRESGETIKKMNKIMKQIGQVKELYNNLKFSEAIKLTETLLKHLKQSYQFFEDLDEIYTLKSYLAASTMLNTDGVGVENLFREIVVMDENYKMDSSVFSPEIVKQYQEIKKEIGEINTGSIEINCEPVDARVYIDGKYMGVTPFVSEQLRVGEHYIKLEAEGFVPYAEILKVSPQVNSVNAALSEYETNRNVVTLKKSLIKSVNNQEKLFPRSILQFLRIAPFEQLILFVVRTTGTKLYVDVQVFDIPTSSMYLKDSFSVNVENSDFENAYFNNIERILSY